jgi:hypothetical protein
VSHRLCQILYSFPPMDGRTLETIYHIRESFHQILDNISIIKNAIKAAINNWIVELAKKDIILSDGITKTLKI